MEPLAEGDYFELARPIDDETEVRAAAYRAIGDAIGEGRLRQEAELVYDAPIPYADYESFRQRLWISTPAERSPSRAMTPRFALGSKPMRSRWPIAFGFGNPVV